MLSAGFLVLLIVLLMRSVVGNPFRVPMRHRKWFFACIIVTLMFEVPLAIAVFGSLSVHWAQKLMDTTEIALAVTLSGLTVGEGLLVVYLTQRLSQRHHRTRAPTPPDQ